MDTRFAYPEREAERQHLGRVQQRIDANLEGLDERLKAYAEDIQAQKEYLWTSRDEMDHIEKISARESIEAAVMTGDNTLARRHKLEKLRSSPSSGASTSPGVARPSRSISGFTTSTTTSPG